MDRNEAIEIVRICCPKISNSECDFETAMRVLVPELAESEDERIRRCIGDAVRKYGEEFASGAVTKEKMLVWLEKQSEPQPYKGNADTMRKNLIKTFKTVGSKHWGGFDVRDIIHFLESKDAIELEKQGEQKSVEWSEEDEVMLQTTIDTLEDFSKGKLPLSDSGYDIAIAEIQWLKSLKPQSHWKPTEEQMNAFYWMKQYPVGEFAKKDILNSLYNDLKKL